MLPRFDNTVEEKLWVVAPAYNEQDSIGPFIEEWMGALRKLNLNFTFLIVNDGSTDRTGEILRDLSAAYPELLVLPGARLGHGQACVAGYRFAIARKANWVLQIDSDGQCDARYFETFWMQRHSQPVQMGFRRRRGDGVARILASRAVSLLCFLACRFWLRDPNVPYRLISAGILEKCTREMPLSDLSNVVLTARLHRLETIHWRDIYFRQRFGGASSFRMAALPRRAIGLYRDLRAGLRDS